jgi:alpha-beta hydrolase superfamily lysophospholipase
MICSEQKKEPSVPQTASAPTSAWREPAAPVARGSVVVLAGRGETEAVYERFATRIAFDGYRVAVVPDATLRVDGAADAVRALLADAPADIPRVLVGSDSGAALAIELAAYEPARIQGLVVAGLPTSSPAAGPLDWDDELAARSACPVHRGRLIAAGVIEPGQLGRAVAPVSEQVAARVAAPALVIHGGADTVTNLADVLGVYASLPDAEVLVVSGGTHDILNDVSHRSVAASIVQFLERLRVPEHAPIVRPLSAVLVS